MVQQQTTQLTLEERMPNLFEQVKTRYSRPPIYGPDIFTEESPVSGKGTALFNFLTMRIGINAPFVRKLSQDGKRSEDKITRGLSSHEFGHYKLHPFQLSLSLYLSYMAHKEFKGLAASIYPLFTDFENNQLILDRDYCKEDLREVLIATWEVSEREPWRAAISYVFNERYKFGLDIELKEYEEYLPSYAKRVIQIAEALGEPLSAEEIDKHKQNVRPLVEHAISELTDICIKSPQDYGTKNEHIINGLQYSQLHRFGEAISPLIELERAGGKDGDEEGEGSGEGVEGTGSDENGEGEGSGSGSSGKNKEGKDKKEGKGKSKEGEDKDKKENKGGKGKGKGKGRIIIDILGQGGGSGAGELITPEDIKNLPPNLRTKIKDALRDLLKNMPPDLYQKIKGHFLGEDKSNSPEHGTGIGTSSADTQDAKKETVEYYRDAARYFGLRVRPKRSLSLSKVSIPFGKREFRTTDSAIGLDTRFSGPRILPGLTKTRRVEPIPYPATREIIPTLLIRKDASGSMWNPNDLGHKCYGTLAGAIFIMSYLRSGSEVGVAIFDTETTDVVHSYDENELLAALCSYKGGGTDLDMEKLRKDLDDGMWGGRLSIDRNIDIEELKRNPVYRSFLRAYERKNAIISVKGLKAKRMTDFVIITDGGIGNIDELLQFFHDNQEFRPTILHTGGYEIKVPGYDQKTSGVYEGITIWKAETREDVIEMTHKSLEQNLLSTYRL